MKKCLLIIFLFVGNIVCSQSKQEQMIQKIQDSIPITWTDIVTDFGIPIDTFKFWSHALLRNHHCVSRSQLYQYYDEMYFFYERTNQRRKPLDSLLLTSAIFKKGHCIENQQEYRTGKKYKFKTSELTDIETTVFENYASHITRKKREEIHIHIGNITLVAVMRKWQQKIFESRIKKGKSLKVDFLVIHTINGNSSFR